MVFSHLNWLNSDKSINDDLIKVLNLSFLTFRRIDLEIEYSLVGNFDGNCL